MMLQGDRMVYISTGEAARERMTDSDCDKVFLPLQALCSFWVCQKERTDHCRSV